MTAGVDVVTGASTQVELVVDLPVTRVWDAVTDVSRIGAASPECVAAAWLPEHVPGVGARFEGHNRFPNGFESTVECVVTEMRTHAVFGWVVLDATRDVACPGSHWRYDMEAVEAGTRIRHRFTHGPGMTGLRVIALERPDEAARIVAERLEQLEANMNVTLRGLLRG